MFLIFVCSQDTAAASSLSDISTDSGRGSAQGFGVDDDVLPVLQTPGVAHRIPGAAPRSDVTRTSVDTVEEFFTCLPADTRPDTRRERVRPVRLAFVGDVLETQQLPRVTRPGASVTVSPAEPEVQLAGEKEKETNLSSG